VRTTNQLAATLSDYRKKAGLTQTQAVELVDLFQKTISKFENDPKTSTLDTFFRLLAVLGLDIELVPRV
jgi:HTH-type transcriptional regulator/antitoxin HipB